MSKSVSLCPDCGACPMVEIDDQEVRIGKRGNLARLAPAEWNVLVQLIKAPSQRSVSAAIVCRTPR